MKKILIINGPNLNLLGVREPSVYGDMTLDDINGRLLNAFPEFSLEFFQSNCEGEIIDAIHESIGKRDGIVINAGAYTHYSYAIRDAIAAVGIPCIEVHMSNVFARDSFRSTSVIAPVCAGSISGFGEKSYFLAVESFK